MQDEVWIDENCKLIYDLTQAKEHLRMARQDQWWALVAGIVLGVLGTIAVGAWW
jgi:hypothetical protein